MFDPIGVSILTNGNRRSKLARCLESLFAYCYFRPLVVGVFDNGSVDDTAAWLEDFSKKNTRYGITIRFKSSKTDLGCAEGTNAACELVRDLEFALHIESDFECMTPEESGEDRLWLRRAVDFMQATDANYLYLRRMVNEVDMIYHWWAQWMPRITEQRGKYLSCPDFWWSNNPALRRNKALYDSGTLPLAAAKDGPKGSGGWSKPELETPRPGKSWIHQWGLFVHEKTSETCAMRKCNRTMKGAECKYGFFKDGSAGDRFCMVCQEDEKIGDMPKHEDRYRKAMGG